MDENPSNLDAGNAPPPESESRQVDAKPMEALPAPAPPSQHIPPTQSLQSAQLSVVDLDAWVDATKHKLNDAIDLRTRGKRKEPTEKKERKPRTKKATQKQPASSQPVVSHHVGNAGGGLAGYHKGQQRTRNESTMLLDVDDYGYGDFRENNEVWTRVKAQAQAHAKQTSKTAAPDPNFIPLGPTIDTSALSPEQCEALDLAIRGTSFFFTGPGGTGKSYLLRVIVAKLLQKFSYQGVHVTASTGVAACNIGGVTLHSWAGCGLAEAPAEKLAQSMLADSKRLRTRQRWQTTNVLIIDEVSMVAGDFFEKLDIIARIVRRNQAPFGGMQLIVAGDFLQLPPVKERLWCFETKAWSETIKETVQLSRVFRQSDAEFVKLLNELRFGQVSYETKTKLHACLNRAIPQDGKIRPTKLLPLKAMVEQENDGEYAKLTGDEHIYDARDWVHPDHPDLVNVMQRDMQAAQRLKLRVGAQVMLLKNLDVEERLFNGARGVVVGFQQDRVMNDGKLVHAGAVYPVVEWAAGKTTLVTSADFTIESSGTILAYRNQLPLTQAWALSIHKAQGSTLDCTELSLAEAFEYGQVYVALSRARSLQGVYLRSLDLKRIKAHPKALAFYQVFGPTVAISIPPAPAMSATTAHHQQQQQQQHHQHHQQHHHQQQQQVPLSTPRFVLPPAPVIPANAAPPPPLPSLAPPPPLRALSDSTPSAAPPSLPLRSISQPSSSIDSHTGQKRAVEVIVIEDSPKRPAPDRSNSSSHLNEADAAPWPPPGFVPAAAGNVVLVHNVRPTFRREVFETMTPSTPSCAAAAAAAAAPQGRMQPRVLFDEKSQYAIGGAEGVRVLDLTDARIDAEFTEVNYLSHAVALPQRPA